LSIVVLPFFVFGQADSIAGLQNNCSLKRENFRMNFSRGVERSAQGLMRKLSFSLLLRNESELQRHAALSEMMSFATPDSLQR
jgi:hypothetical protein